ncbi:MAG: nucleoside deaminase [Propionibacteriaceae bacterium]|jgi:tRNA(adenine34) deaminase|nr:nucleoside deaminase [Propionibacteriaceae bacterium]
MTIWDETMRLALAEAELARAHGDVPVGAVVLGLTGEILASAHNERAVRGDPLAHAEVNVLHRAAAAVGGWRLDGCTLVVTLEPCAMCAGAISQTRLARLVFGAFDEKAGAVASLWDLLRDLRLPHRPEVVSGVLADECAMALQTFFAERR